MSEHDSAIPDEEYLEFLRDHAGAGLEEVTDRDIGEGVLAPDFASQLVAIRSVLARNHEAEEQAAAQIKKLEAEIRERGGSSWVEDHWVDHLHGSVFLDAAHSMAAVGLIAPLIESLFDRAFRYLRRQVGESYLPRSGHKRWQLDDRWDHRYVWERGRSKRTLFERL